MCERQVWVEVKVGEEGREASRGAEETTQGEETDARLRRRSCGNIILYHRQQCKTLHVVHFFSLFRVRFRPKSDEPTAEIRV